MRSALRFRSTPKHVPLNSRSLGMPRSCIRMDEAEAVVPASSPQFSFGTGSRISFGLLRVRDRCFCREDSYVLLTVLMKRSTQVQAMASQQPQLWQNFCLEISLIEDPHHRTLGNHDRDRI